MGILFADEQHIEIIKDLTAEYDSKFSKFGYGWHLSELYADDYIESQNVFMFDVPSLNMNPFNLDSAVSISHISCDNKLTSMYDITFPQYARSEKDLDNILDGIENIIKAKKLYDDYLDELLKLTK